MKNFNIDNNKSLTKTLTNIELFTFNEFHMQIQFWKDNFGFDEYNPKIHSV